MRQALVEGVSSLFRLDLDAVMCLRDLRLQGGQPHFDALRAHRGDTAGSASRKLTNAASGSQVAVEININDLGQAGESQRQGGGEMDTRLAG